jgi:hypothetical protein
MHHTQIFVFNSIFSLNKFFVTMSLNKFILWLKENYFFMMAKMRNFAKNPQIEQKFAEMSCLRKNFQLLPFREIFLPFRAKKLCKICSNFSSLQMVHPMPMKLLSFFCLNLKQS